MRVRGGPPGRMLDVLPAEDFTVILTRRPGPLGGGEGGGDLQAPPQFAASGIWLLRVKIINRWGFICSSLLDLEWGEGQTYLGREQVWVRRLLAW